MTWGICLEVKEFDMIVTGKCPTAKCVETVGEDWIKIRQRLITKKLATLVQDRNLVEDYPKFDHQSELSNIILDL